MRVFGKTSVVFLSLVYWLNPFSYFWYSMRKLFNLRIKTCQKFMCESDPKKQLFLRLTNPNGGILIGNALDLVKPVVKNVFDGVMSAIPWTFILVGGFVCSDKAPTINNTKFLRTSMQDGVGATSMTFEMIYSYILLALPTIVILENLKELLITDLDQSTLSDCTYVMQKLRAAGYALCTYLIVKAQDYCSGAARIRIYFIAMRIPLSCCGDSGFLIQVKREMSLLHDAFRCGGGNPADFMAPLQVDDDEEDEKEDGKRRQLGKKYKDDHLEVFLEAGFTWPPDLEQASEVNFTGMTQRVSEVVWYMHMKYKANTSESHRPSTIQFFDANNSITRTLAWDQNQAVQQRRSLGKTCSQASRQNQL